MVLSFAPTGFSPGTLVLSSPQKSTFPNSNSTRSQVDKAKNHFVSYLQIIISINFTYYLIYILFRSVIKWAKKPQCNIHNDSQQKSRENHLIAFLTFLFFLTTNFSLLAIYRQVHSKYASQSECKISHAYSQLTLSPSATSQIFSSVTGFIVGNVFPLTESTNSLLMKSCLGRSCLISNNR